MSIFIFFSKYCFILLTSLFGFNITFFNKNVNIKCLNKFEDMAPKEIV